MSDELTPRVLAELKRLNDVSEPPPWDIDRFTGEMRNGDGDSPRHWFHGDAVWLAVTARNALSALLAAVEERDRLRKIVETHDLCHNLLVQVDARAFADGCAAEQRKLYGCAPDADELVRVRATAEASERCLRSLASWLGTGGYNADEFVPDAFEAKIRQGVDLLMSAETARITEERDRLRADLANLNTMAAAIVRLECENQRLLDTVGSFDTIASWLDEVLSPDEDTSPGNCVERLKSLVKGVDAIADLAVGQDRESELYTEGRLGELRAAVAKLQERDGNV